LLVWAPAERLDEGTKLVEEWGFERRATVLPRPDAAPNDVLLVASRRNPVATPAGGASL
jgi:hypothetical protein